MSKIYVVGIGPGDKDVMTAQAAAALDECDVIIGYKTYTDLLKDRYPDKEIIESSMRMESRRCEKCLELAREGRRVALVCSGDAGVYGMASPMLETALKGGFDNVEIIPGVTAALSGAAILGAPLGHDHCIISLSDLLTPWELIEKRLECAAKGDFCIVIYNPASHKRKDHLKKACEVLLRILPENTVCGYVRNIGRDGCLKKLCTLTGLAGEEVDMFTTVFIGNSMTYIKDGKMITPRGYDIK
ncbi:MAG: precorrin-3B C(17)-methyltransferase [Lachnospiraceae bacterium]|nr:precorrin-3B C(17)-methyltransferase [Lachnospiraceae bacterium]MBR6468854.1 precorrin-3B C(17)-methyltransferase [Lachnospiraceae bacterium]